MNDINEMHILYTLSDLVSHGYGGWRCTACGDADFSGMSENERQYRDTGTYDPHDPLIEHDELGFPRWDYPNDPSEV